MNKEQERMVVELWLRLRDRCVRNKSDAELDLKILEKWRKDFEDLKKVRK
jgi:hypothetical protein